MPFTTSRVKPDVLRSIAGSTLTTAYQAVGAALTQVTRIVKFTNTCNVDVTISWDNSNDNEYIPAGSFLLLDMQTNTTQPSENVIPIGTTFYAKSTTSGTGALYISTYYSY